MMDHWKEQAKTWERMPLSSSVVFFAGVFCLFASLVLVGSSTKFQSETNFERIGAAIISGGFAIGWAYAGTRRVLWMLLLLAVPQFACFTLLAWLSGPHHDLAGVALEHKLRLNGYAAIMLIIAGYALFVFFFNFEGARFFRTQTEVQLAGEIHRTLVPPRHDTIGTVELFGTSIPSGEVGGDLFDIVRSHGGWHAYVADVSGHGVAAGMLMSMIKSTASMQLTKLNKPADLLSDLNDVMQPITAPANYVTFAYVGGKDGDESLVFALAGHLPILHYRAQAQSIVEHSDSNLPIGLFRNRTFEISHLSLLPGDLLAIITDGFTEVVDSQEREIGLEEFKSQLLACAQQSLPEIYRGLRSATMRFGKQTDDQTLLLIRRLG
jgi:hypothetical protein